MTTELISIARERVLDVAERLFSERGYAAVTLRDIAGELGMRQASLYHHAPGGKEALYVEVIERSLARHSTGLEKAIADSPGDLRAQLHGAATWLLSQPPMDISRMMRADMPAISPETAQRVSGLMYNALLAPLRRCFESAAGQLRQPMTLPDLLAGSFVGIIELLHDVEQFARVPKQQLADDMINVLLEGVLPRH